MSTFTAERLKLTSTRTTLSLAAALAGIVTLAALVHLVGFDTAVVTATHAVDALHSTAEAHARVMILEVMGRHSGAIALHAGVAGGADVVLIPEIPYRLETIVAKVRERESLGMGRGARPIQCQRHGHSPEQDGATP